MSRKKSSGKVNDLYLIPEFENGEFEYPTVISNSKEVIDKLIETKELKHLTNLLTIESIYKEDVFWEQIKHWKLLEYFYREVDNSEALKEIENIQASLCKGFKQAIKSHKPTKQGRPSKSINLDDDLDIVEEYITLEKRIRNEFGKPDMTRRREGLTEYLKEPKVLGRKINLSENKIKTLIKKSSSEIANSILAAALGVGIRKIKSFIAKINYTPQDAVVFELPNRKKRKVSWDLFDETRIEILKEAKMKKHKISEQYLTVKLSRKLKIPPESIAKIFESGVGVDFFSQSNQPHKNR